MIDIHCHLLPEMDDGARSLDMAEEMARQAVADGIEAVVVTPHSGPSEDRLDPQRILKGISELRERLSASGIPLKIFSGEEIQLSPGVSDELQAGEILPMGEGKWVLVELPFNHVPMFAESTLFSIQTAGFRPVVAHPERNIDIQRDWQIAAGFVERGAALQLDTLSLMGIFGPQARTSARQLLRAGIVHAIGSDGHSTDTRRIALSDAREQAARIVGDKGASLLVKDNPQAMLTGGAVVAVEPLEIPEKKGFFSSLKRLFSNAG